jgi:hypothetical protein
VITKWAYGLRRAAGPAALTGLVLGVGLTGPASGALAAAHPAVAPGTISTIAGGVGGPGQATTISVAPCGVTFNGTSLYVPGGGVVRSIDTSEALTTPVGDGLGNGPRGYGAGVPAAQSGLEDPQDVAFDHHGNLVLDVEGRYAAGRGAPCRSSRREPAPSTARP